MWRCAKDHEWSAMPKLVVEGAWCYRCAMRSGASGILKHLKALASARGGKCLSQEYITDNAYLEWECVHGHRWEALPGPIKNRGVWCPHCAHKAWLGIEEMQRTAEQRDGECLSEEYKGNHVKLLWQCEKGHTWMATPGHFRSGKWCPHHDCRYRKSAEKLRGDIGEVHLIAKLRGGTLVSKTYLNRKTPVKWRCGAGHTWTAAFNNVKFGGTWCPECPRVPGAKEAFKKEWKALMEQDAAGEN